MMNITKELPIDLITAKVKNGVKFSFSRWGDGEWNCLRGKQGMNCDSHIYFPDLGKRLDEIIKSNPDYYIGLQTLAYRLNKDVIDRYTEEYNLSWCKSDVFHHANISGEIKEFFKALEHKDVLLVGGSHLSRVKEFDYRFYSIPRGNCWLKHDEILTQLKDIIFDNTIVLFCASMMSNVLIDELYGKGTLIDFGSVLDPYAGVMSRTYHKKLKLSE